MQCSLQVIILFLGVILENALGQRYEGDLCTISSSGTTGTCQLLSLCSSAKAALGRGTIPTNCGFKGSIPIVCCTDGSTTPTRSDSQTKTVTAINRIVPKLDTNTLQSVPSEIFQNVGDKSRAKCREYGRYVKEQAAFIAPLGQSPPPDSAVCATDEIESIVGGIPAKPKEFPHMAAVGFGDVNNIEWGCGGSLISEKFVLSAAHCSHHSDFGVAKHVLLGALLLNSSNDAQSQRILIKNITVHPKYLHATKENDIALFELERSPELGSYIRPACLNTNRNLKNNVGIVCGWGKTENYGSISQQLLKVDLDMITNIDCKRTFKNINEEIQVCAGSREEKDTCQGDSGGPLQILNSEEAFCTYKIIGITSYGKYCGKTIPGVYTRVSNYIEWIEGIIWS